LSRIKEIEDASFDDPYPYELFVTLLADLPEGFRVAEESNSLIVGYCILSRSNLPTTILISSIAVDPKFRNRGIGTELIRDAIRVAKELSALNPVKSIILQVAENNPTARDLYEKMGFQNARKIANYYGRGKHAIQIELALD